MDKLSTVFVSSLETTLFQFRALLFFFLKKGRLYSMSRIYLE